MDSPTISTENLTRRFGELVAVEDVNLRVAAGQFFGFLGPNGAGKSTTIKMLTGLLAPSSGRIQILGRDLITNTVEVKRQIGVVPEGMALFGRSHRSGVPEFRGPNVRTGSPNRCQPGIGTDGVHAARRSAQNDGD